MAKQNTHFTAENMGIETNYVTVKADKKTVKKCVKSLRKDLAAGSKVPQGILPSLSHLKF